MNPLPSRRFGTLDGLIAVASVALGLGLTRAYLRMPTGYSQGSWAPIYLTWDGLDFPKAAHAVPPGLSALTLGWLAIALRRPRPPFRRLARRPGALACLAATSAVVVAQIQGFIHYKFYIDHFFTRFFLFHFGDHAGLAVLGAWLALAVGRRWRPDPGWIDRVGRFLGACWVVLALVTYDS